VLFPWSGRNAERVLPDADSTACWSVRTTRVVNSRVEDTFYGDADCLFRALMRLESETCSQ